MKKLFIIFCVMLIGGLFGGGVVWLSSVELGLNEITESIMWESTDEPNTRLYHVRGNVATGQSAQAIAMKIYGIEGVSNVQPMPYCFIVSISPIYKWSEVDSRIAGIVDDVKNMSSYLKSAPAGPLGEVPHGT